MIVLLDTPQDLNECAEELGETVGQLLTPLTRRVNRSVGAFAIDNGAYAGFDRSKFENLLARHEPSKVSCLFVAVPDVVGSARRTLEAFDYWHQEIGRWPLALVAQDGIDDISIPWKLLTGIFIGGSTAFKMSEAARHVIRCAQLQSKWVHVGRVNTPERFLYFEELGVDSVDGTGLSRYSHMRLAIRDRRQSPQYALPLTA